jgi:hypothetical protein
LLTAISTATRVPSLARPRSGARPDRRGCRRSWWRALEKIGTSRPRSPAAEIERAAEDLRRRVAEDALARGIEGFDVAGVVDRDDGVLDVVEDGLQMRGGLFADLAGERLRLVRHELHRAHDAAPLPSMRS